MRCLQPLIHILLRLGGPLCLRTCEILLLLDRGFEGRELRGDILGPMIQPGLGCHELRRCHPVLPACRRPQIGNV